MPKKSHSKLAEYFKYRTNLKQAKSKSILYPPALYKNKCYFYTLNFFFNKTMNQNNFTYSIWDSKKFNKKLQNELNSYFSLTKNSFVFN
ncbi:hypothetical protein EM308_01500 [Flavobacterium gilvum]|uniref:Uncharacterized protein n=1 Tax=Flavobacterium gilvum TaxID=1492737 RepID=A0AAC9I421_9FLAO|nr:hypothetical protein EM308_01500 [Flavobacterium gilvum]